MGCCQSKRVVRFALDGSDEIKDLAYSSAFPGGRKKIKKPVSPDFDEYSDDESTQPDIHDQCCELFPSDDEDEVERSHKSVITTHKVQVGILEGTTFLNNYIVVDTLGKGSFGKVKLCLNVVDDELYAIKVIDKNMMRQLAKSRQLQGGFGRLARPSMYPICEDDDLLANIKREVEIMRNLDHPNLVKLYEVIDSRESGKLFLVMEYCQAGALVRPGQLTPDRRMPESIAQYYFKQVAHGLAYLHDNGIIHGDMKPENIMLSGNATVKITDFGASQVMQGKTDDHISTTLGTPAFLAPEICAGKDYKGRPVDIWALGVSLYNFIYGELPFQAESVLDLYEMISEGDISYPESVPISMELQDLLLRLLAKDPKHRITADEILQHPWVKEDDMLTLMPSLFSADYAMFSNDDALVQSPQRSQQQPQASGSGSGNNRNNISRMASLLSNNAPGSPMAMLQPADSSRLPAPAPADVAAAVFPTLSLGRSSGGGSSHNFLESIVSALVESRHKHHRLFGKSDSNVSSSSGKSESSGKGGGGLHYLSRDSAVMPKKDGNSNHSNNSGNGGGSSMNKAAMFLYDDSFRSDISSATSDMSDSSIQPPGLGSGKKEGINEESKVERSAPSVFTVMVQHMKQAQAEIMKGRFIHSGNSTDTTTTTTSGGGSNDTTTNGDNSTGGRSIRSGPSKGTKLATILESPSSADQHDLKSPSASSSSSQQQQQQQRPSQPLPSSTSKSMPSLPAIDAGSPFISNSNKQQPDVVQILSGLPSDYSSQDFDIEVDQVLSENDIDNNIVIGGGNSNITSTSTNNNNSSSNITSNNNTSVATDINKTARNNNSNITANSTRDNSTSTLTSDSTTSMSASQSGPSLTSSGYSLLLPHMSSPFASESFYAKSETGLSGQLHPMQAALINSLPPHLQQQQKHAVVVNNKNSRMNGGGGGGGGDGDGDGGGGQQQTSNNNKTTTTSSSSSTINGDATKAETSHTISNKSNPQQQQQQQQQQQNDDTSVHNNSNNDNNNDGDGDIDTKQSEEKGDLSIKTKPVKRSSFLQRLSFKKDKDHHNTTDNDTTTHISSDIIDIELIELQPGDMLTYTHGPTNTIYYIESGAIELRWEAALPVSLNTVFSQALHMLPVQSTSSSRSSNETRAFDRIDSVAFTAPHVTNLTAIVGKTVKRLQGSETSKRSMATSTRSMHTDTGTSNTNSSGGGENAIDDQQQVGDAHSATTDATTTTDSNNTNTTAMKSTIGDAAGSDSSARRVRFSDNTDDVTHDNSTETDHIQSYESEVIDPLQRTLIQATERAEALMENATGGSLDNLLLVRREASQYIGALSMLDPDFFSAKWRANAVAMEHSVVIRMTRKGLDLFLTQNPLAQVHLRASMALARSEVIKLESLERIANVYRKQLRKWDSSHDLKSGNSSMKMSDLGKIFGMSLEEAVDTVGGSGKMENKGQQHGAVQTAALDLFALVSKLRAQF